MISAIRMRLRGAFLLASATYTLPGYAQQAAPVTVTPPSLRPQPTDNGFRIDIPSAGALSAPRGAESLSVTLASVSLEGGFAEVASQTDPILEQLRGRRVTLAQIYAAASEIEAAHARAGYVLARVSVPPQDLHDGGALRIVVTDGFVETVDVSGLPKAVRATVAARTAGLRGRRHITLSEIEQPLLIASHVPGLTLKSTLARGDSPGGTKIILDGTQRLLSGSIGGDNQLDRSLGTYGVSAQLSLNSALGLGEQIYGFVSSGDDVRHLFNSDARERVLGGGIVLPIGDGRLTLNPEATFSRTQPLAPAGAPPTLGDLHRYSLRAGYTLRQTRVRSLVLNGTVELIDEQNAAQGFAVALSHDRYMTARVGGSYTQIQSNGTVYSVEAQVSRGLGGVGAISRADAAASTVPFSRQGSDTNFTKLTLQLRGVWAPSKSVDVNVTAKGQTSFGDPVFRAEQFALEGPDAASAYVGGVTAVDQGFTARLELGTHVMLGHRTQNIRLAPYLFGAAGIGSINAATALEPDIIGVGAVGAGARLALLRWGLSLNVEYAHGLSDIAALNAIDRVNFSTNIRF